MTNSKKTLRQGRYRMHDVALAKLLDHYGLAAAELDSSLFWYT
jgi:hypothetical protein